MKVFCLKRRCSNVSPIYYIKSPIFYPKNKPVSPNPEDYEILGITQESTNRDLVNSFRQLSFPLHPANNRTPAASLQYLRLVEAYDKVALFRMAEYGVPQPINQAYYPPPIHGKLMREFFEDNSF